MKASIITLLLVRAAMSAPNMIGLNVREVPSMTMMIQVVCNFGPGLDCEPMIMGLSCCPHLSLGPAMDKRAPIREFPGVAS